jgi:hypothetical protein
MAALEPWRRPQVAEVTMISNVICFLLGAVAPLALTAWLALIH